MGFSKNRELAALRQHGFLNEKNSDFLDAFFLRREETTRSNPFITIASES